jgi:hypothetical protein
MSNKENWFRRPHLMEFLGLVQHRRKFLHKCCLLYSQPWTVKMSVYLPMGKQVLEKLTRWRVQIRTVSLVPKMASYMSMQEFCHEPLFLYFRRSSVFWRQTFQSKSKFRQLRFTVTRWKTYFREPKLNFSRRVTNQFTWRVRLGEPLITHRCF